MFPASPGTEEDEYCAEGINYTTFYCESSVKLELNSIFTPLPSFHKSTLEDMTFFLLGQNQLFSLKTDPEDKNCTMLEQFYFFLFFVLNNFVVLCI